MLIKYRCLLMHLNTHFIFSTLPLSTIHSYSSLIMLFREDNPGPTIYLQKRTQALTLNGHVSSAKSLMDDANYHKLGRPHKGSGSICDACSSRSEMLDDDIRSKHGTRQQCIVGVGGDREGKGQECEALSFPMRREYLVLS